MQVRGKTRRLKKGFSLVRLPGCLSSKQRLYFATLQTLHRDRHCLPRYVTVAPIFVAKPKVCYHEKKNSVVWSQDQNLKPF
jgi:hypothetical protein